MQTVEDQQFSVQLRRHMAGLCSTDLAAREQAMRGLLQLGAAAIPYLQKAMQHENAEVRRMAARVLQEMGWQPSSLRERSLFAYASQMWDALMLMGEAALPALERALQDANFYVRTSAALSLGEIQHQRVLQLLARALTDENSYVRSAVVHALRQQGSAALKLLGQALVDEDKGVRRAAAQALSDLGEDAVPLLVETLQSCDWYYRNEVAAALGALGSLAVPALLELLSHPEIGYDAAQILRSLGVSPEAHGYHDIFR